jgi:peptidoglycan-N-acetylglucosamine deacetylase
MRYPWPDGCQSAAVLSFDVDAESGFIFREPERARRSLAGLEERRFGPRVGVDRILRLLDRLKLRGSFFIPGWTVEHHLAASRRIRDAGHEIGAHGNVHEAVDGLDRAAEERIMRDQLAILRDHLGVRPTGYRSPSWDVNVWTPSLLKAHGFLYDSSLMGNDVPYDLDTEAGPLVEVPVQWLLDDAPLFRHVYGATNAIADPGRVLQMWSREFAAMHQENGCFVLTCHPFLSGRASRIDLLEELVRFMRRARGVWFTTGEAVAQWHAAVRDGGGRRASTKRARRRAAHPSGARAPTRR